jgi:transcriptional regulator with XRE-family HTH domain
MLAERQVARCLNCRLVQFIMPSNLCRRCRKTVVPEELEPPTAPAPLVLVPAPAADFSQIGAAVRELRLRLNMTQRELAFRMCVARSYISKLESGRHTPSVYSLSRLAKALSVDLSALLCEPWERDPFLTELAGYVARLDSDHRAMILNTAREFATAKGTL